MKNKSNGLSNSQDTSTLVEEFFSSISIGYSSAVLPPTNISDSVASYIDSRNLKGDVILSSPSGYYRPYPFDDHDNEAFNSYIESELSRAEEIIARCQSMQMTYEIIKDSIINKWKELAS